MNEVQKLIDEGVAMLDMIDAVEAREEKERTMGSMALSSYCEDMFQQAMAKVHEAYSLCKPEEDGTLES